MGSKLQFNLWKTDSEWFRPWFNSEAYHVLYGHRSDSEASNFVSTLSRHAALNSGGKVLDAGCGAGRHARAWSKLGWEVHAFDLSPESISAAKDHSDRPTPAYRVLDLRSLVEVSEWEGRFDLVTNFFTSLGYFDDPSDQRAVMQGFAHALKPGGWLLIDFLNVHQVKANLISEEKLVREGVEFTIHRRIHEGWIEKSIQFMWKGEPHHHVERVQALEPDHFSEMLSHNGLKVHFLYGDYDLAPWRESSPRCLILAQKS
jgi:SAM-dependent methyltransferase